MKNQNPQLTPFLISDIGNIIENKIPDNTTKMNYFFEKNIEIFKIFHDNYFFQKNNNKKIVKKNYFLCNRVYLLGLDKKNDIIIDNALKNCFLTKEKKICHKKSILSDVLLLKKMRIFKKISVFVQQNKINGSFDIYIKLNKFKNRKINKISFDNTFLIPNFIKRNFNIYFVGRQANLTMVALMKQTIDSWYNKWDYLGSCVDQIVGLEDGDIEIYVREPIIKSFNFVIIDEKPMEFEAYTFKEENLIASYKALQNPLSKLFLSLIGIKVGQPYNSNVNNDYFSFIEDACIFEDFFISDSHPYANETTFEEFKYNKSVRSDIEYGKDLVDIYCSGAICSLNNQLTQFSIYKDTEDEYNEDRPFEYAWTPLMGTYQWEIRNFNKKIEILSLMIEKETDLNGGFDDEIEFNCEYFLPYFNYTSENAITSLTCLLFCNEGSLIINDYIYDFEDLVEFAEISTREENYIDKYWEDQDPLFRTTNLVEDSLGEIQNYNLPKAKYLKIFEQMYNSMEELHDMDMQLTNRLQFHEENSHFLNHEQKTITNKLKQYKNDENNSLISDKYNYESDNTKCVEINYNDNINIEHAISTNSDYIYNNCSFQNEFKKEFADLDSLQDNNLEYYYDDGGFEENYDTDDELEDLESLKTHSLGLKLIFDEKLENMSKFVTSFVLNYIIFEDDFFGYIDFIENFDGEFPNDQSSGILNSNEINRDMYPLLASLQNIDIKLATQFLYFNNNTFKYLTSIVGNKLMFYSEIGLVSTGFFSKNIINYTNYQQISSKIINEFRLITSKIFPKISKIFKTVPFIRHIHSAYTGKVLKHDFDTKKIKIYDKLISNLYVLIEKLSYLAINFRIKILNLKSQILRSLNHKFISFKYAANLNYVPVKKIIFKSSRFLFDIFPYKIITWIKNFFLISYKKIFPSYFITRLLKILLNNSSVTQLIYLFYYPIVEYFHLISKHNIKFIKFLFTIQTLINNNRYPDKIMIDFFVKLIIQKKLTQQRIRKINILNTSSFFTKKIINSYYNVWKSFYNCSIFKRILCDNKIISSNKDIKYLLPSFALFCLSKNGNKFFQYLDDVFFNSYYTEYFFSVRGGYCKLSEKIRMSKLKWKNWRKIYFNVKRYLKNRYNKYNRILRNIIRHRWFSTKKKIKRFRETVMYSNNEVYTSFHYFLLHYLVIKLIKKKVCANFIKNLFKYFYKNMYGNIYFFALKNLDYIISEFFKESMRLIYLVPSFFVELQLNEFLNSNFCRNILFFKHNKSFINFVNSISMKTLKQWKKNYLKIFFKYHRFLVQNNIILSLLKISSFNLVGYSSKINLLNLTIDGGVLNYTRVFCLGKFKIQINTMIFDFFKTLINNHLIQIFHISSNVIFSELLSFFTLPNSISMINNFKLGLNYGFTPFYDAFILGGINSVRGYSDGEIGVSKSFIQSSFEIRVSKEGYFEKYYTFFDYCSDLNTSKNILYNPSDYKLMAGQGSSIGIGLMLGTNRIEYGINTTNFKSFINFEYGEKY